jgi:hypothetical protein
MKRLVLVLTFMAAFVGQVFASDESLAKGVPGAYARSTGMFTDTVDLRRDGTFVFTHRFDVGSDSESGTWKVVDAVVHLDPKTHGRVIQHWPSKFVVVTVDGDLALRVLDDGMQSDDEQEPMLLFRPIKKTANRAPEPATMAVTICASTFAGPTADRDPFCWPAERHP